MTCLRWSTSRTTSSFSFSTIVPLCKRKYLNSYHLSCSSKNLKPTKEDAPDKPLHKTLKNLWAYFFIIKQSQRSAIRRQQILHHFIINFQCRNFQHKVSVWVLCIKESFCEELIQDIELYTSNCFIKDHLLNKLQAQRLSCWTATWIASKWCACQHHATSMWKEICTEVLANVSNRLLHRTTSPCPSSKSLCTARVRLWRISSYSEKNHFQLTHSPIPEIARKMRNWLCFEDTNNKPSLVGLPPNKNSFIDAYSLLSHFP